jgi:hypothetical protein
MYQKSAAGMSSLAPVGWITPAGVSNGPRKVPRIDSSIARRRLKGTAARGVRESPESGNGL